MAQQGSSLLLLVLVISLCESAEYYIRPTTLTTNAPCPGQPCLTLNQYMNNTGYYYIQSNTVLNFLPGKHVLKRSLEIINVENVTLKSGSAGSGMHSQLLVDISCVNKSLDHCIYTHSAIKMTNVTNVVINDISLEMWTPNVTGVTVEQSTDVHLQLDIQGINSHAIGVAANETRRLYVERLRADNLYNGIRIEKTSTLNITNSSFDNCQSSGMVIINSDAIDISNTTLSNNMESGMYLESCSNATLTSISATYNQFDGIDLISCSSVSMKDITAINIDSEGGIYMYACENTTMINVSAINNGDGIFILECDNTTLMNISAINNQYSGICMYTCENATLMNISTINNTDGICMLDCKNTTMMNVSAINNEDNGIYIHKCENTTMMKISAINNQDNGIGMDECDTTIIMNVSAINNEDYGIYMYKCENTTMMKISAMNNQDDGIGMDECDTTIMMNVSAINNEDGGIYMYKCENTTMMKISAINNQDDGILMAECKNTTQINISAINNQLTGVNIIACKNTTMMKISAIKNQYVGIIKSHCNNTILADVNAMYNQYGGIFILYHFQNILLRNLSLNHNGNTEIEFLSSHNVQLEDSTFSDVAISTVDIATDPHTVPAVIKLNDCTLILSNCIFTRNKVTSIRAIGSKIVVQGEIIFSDNRALSGAALLFDSSVLVTSETSTVHFQNNRAVNYGGAIYILTDVFYNRTKFYRDDSFLIPSTRYFLSLEGNRSQARLIFTNNTAGKGGDVVYGGLVALGYDGDWNCLLSFKNVSDMSQQNGLSLISSEPSRVCLCHNGQPDCLIVADPITRSVYPGQTITLPAVVVGQDFGTVTGSVIAQFLQDYTTCPTQLEQGERSTIVNNANCANLSYTLYTSGGENCTAILTLKTSNAEVLEPMNTDDNHKLNKSWIVVNEEPNYRELANHLLIEISTVHGCLHPTTDNCSEVLGFLNNFLKFYHNESYKTLYNSYKFVFPIEIYNYPTFINISFRSCPSGFSLSRNPPFKCDCNHLLQQMPRVTCDIQHQTISRDGLVWVGTYDNETVAASKYCPYNYCKSIHTDINLESDGEYTNQSTTDFQCNLHHSGVLCGGCQPGLSLALGTNQCLPCSNIYISLLLPFAMAGLLLVFFIKLLNLTISQGTMNELIFYVNVVSANKYLYYSQTSVNPMTLFIAWFNLDLGIETCFFNGLTAYSRTWLQFVFPLYIWAIAGLIIIIAKYSNRMAKVIGNNGVPVLATLFFLSYAKLFNTIITALSYTRLYTTQDQNYLVWSADGNVDYFGPKHIPLFCVAVAALVFLWFPYTLLLLLGQWLHRLNCRIITRMLLNLKPFLDAHFAALKDKHRYWFGLLLLVRAANLLISASISDTTTGIVELSTATLSILLTFWGQKVYRSSAVGTFGTALLANLAITNVMKLFSIISNGKIAVASLTLIAIALAQFLGLILYKVVVVIKSSPKMTACCPCEKKQSDDWELYEQAALEREMESDSDDRESDEFESGSIESVPTYGV